MSVARLHVIADRGACASDEAYLAVLSDLSASSALTHAALHVRIKERERLLLARLARAVTRSLSAAGVPVLLNGTLAEAEALGFDGVHWPQAQIPEERVSASVLCGASVHDLTSLAWAQRAGAHYVMFGPVWPPQSKIAAPAGIAALTDMCRRTRLPVVALGGITRERVHECLRAGAHGVAVVSAVMHSDARASAVAALFAELNPHSTGEHHANQQ